MLADVQRGLARLYDLDLQVSVEDFLCDETEAQALGGVEATRRGEVLFVVNEAEGPRVALYVAEKAWRRREVDWWGPEEAFTATCLGVEGVSHFVYLAFRADHEGTVSELELELQAEVDKWALGLLGPGTEPQSLLSGQGAAWVRARDRSRQLRARLYADAAFLDAPESVRGARYRAATRLAARYTEALERQFVDRGAWHALSGELRRFYRLGGHQKMDRAG